MRLSHIVAGALLLTITGAFVMPSPASAQLQNRPTTAIAYRGQGMGHKMKEGYRDTTDALHITPSVKAAIIGDGQLNDRRNHINVGTKDYVLHLTGHVYSRAIKERASRVAAHKLAKMHKGYKVSNELTIAH